MEIIVVIVVLSIVSTIMISYVATTSDLYMRASRKRDADGESSAALTRIQREFRAVQSVVAADTNLLSFVEPGFGTNVLRHSGGDLLWNGNYLARNVMTFGLRYYDQTNGPLTALPLSAADRLRVRRIGVNMVVRKGGQSSDLYVNLFYPEAGTLK
ncbi:MAG: hypothetical protein C0404_08510 [Verrucomicrobia bacterium]|nr:hypothetical protein [Verrucomicrobiota bacterium]